MPYRATPLETLNDEVAAAAAAVAERERLRTTVALNRGTLTRLNARVRAGKELLRREERSFTKFDRLSLPALICGVLGTRDRRRREEYEQWLRVRQSLLVAMAERDRLVERTKRLQARETSLADAPERLARALRRKEAWLRKNDRDAMGRLCLLDEGERALKQELSRIERALDAGREAQKGTQVSPRSVVWNQLVCLQEMQRKKVRRLKEIGRERHLLLMDGAAHAGSAATPAPM